MFFLEEDEILVAFLIGSQKLATFHLLCLQNNGAVKSRPSSIQTSLNVFS